MVSRLLSQCGVYLGPENELMAPAPDNPEGYWENIHFVDLNDRLLAHLRAGGRLVCNNFRRTPNMVLLCQLDYELYARGSKQAGCHHFM